MSDSTCPSNDNSTTGAAVILGTGTPFSLFAPREHLYGIEPRLAYDSQAQAMARYMLDEIERCSPGLKPSHDDEDQKAFFAKLYSVFVEQFPGGFTYDVLVDFAKAKADQHPDIQRLLIETENREIVYIEAASPEMASSINNLFGKALMEVRRYFIQEDAAAL